MNIDWQQVGILIGVISGSGGLTAFLGFKSNKKVKNVQKNFDEVENHHKSFKYDSEIRLAKLEQQVQDLSRETHADIKEMKSDIHYIRTKLEK